MTDDRTTMHERTTYEPEPTQPTPMATRVGSSVRTTERSYATSGPGGAAILMRVVAFLFGILQVGLILRIVLLLLVANPGNDIVDLILTWTDPFVEPFRGMFALDRVTAEQGSVLDIAAIVALIGWTLVEALILAAIRIFDRRDRTTALA